MTPQLKGGRTCGYMFGFGWKESTCDEGVEQVAQAFYLFQAQLTALILASSNRTCLSGLCSGMGSF